MVKRPLLPIPKVLLMPVQKSPELQIAALLLPSQIVGTATFNRSVNSHK
jgi:hypothetical protein